MEPLLFLSAHSCVETHIYAANDQPKHVEQFFQAKLLLHVAGGKKPSVWK